MADTDQTRTFVIPHPGFDDRCPDMPEGVSDWERQEINRCWRNAMTYGRDIMAGIEHDLNVRVPEGRPMANNAQRMAQYVSARTELAARIDAVEHRKALAGRVTADDETLQWWGVEGSAMGRTKLGSRDEALAWLADALNEGHVSAQVYLERTTRTVITTPEKD